MKPEEIEIALGPTKDDAMGMKDDTNDALETHLAAYNRAMKSNDAAGMAEAFRAAVASCQGYAETETE